MFLNLTLIMRNGARDLALASLISWTHKVSDLSAKPRSGKGSDPELKNYVEKLSQV